MLSVGPLSLQVGSGPPLDPPVKGTRGKIRRLIAEELEACARLPQNGATGSRCPAPEAHDAEPIGGPRSTSGRRTAPSRASGTNTGAGRRTPARAASAPALTSLPQIGPTEVVRKLQYRRNPNGGFLSDAPPWQVDTSTAPILPSKHREISKNMWASLNATYEKFPEMSEARRNHMDPKQGPLQPLFTRPWDDAKRYQEEISKFGNQQIIRKGGGSMDQRR